MFVRREKLTNPFLPLLLGTLAMFYLIFTEGIVTNVVAVGAAGALLGLLINAIYSFTKRRMKA